MGSMNPQTQKELYIYPLTGLYDECHAIEYTKLANAKRPEAAGPYSLRNLNNLWWKEVTSLQTLEQIIIGIANRYQGRLPDARSHRIVAASPELFKSEVQEAVKGLANLGAGPKKLFRHLETLQMFCNLYSDFISYPYRLSLQDGLLLNEIDTESLFHEALDETKNAYLPFLREYAFPIIAEAKADLVWLVGPPKASLIACAFLAKQANPSCHISIIGHSTEYYSLNKITKLLKKNDLLFSLIDSIVLDDFEHTIPQLRDAVTYKDSLSSVPNLLFRDSEKGITQTQYQKTDDKSISFNSAFHEDSVTPDLRGNDWIDFGTVVTAKLWPNAKCFWSSCTFCAINKKYNTLPVNDFTNSSPAAEFFAGLPILDKGYLWSIDEAIPPENLGDLADKLINGGTNVLWETRSKIHQGFTKELCKKLHQAGLREIRLGLESASARVLEAMGKHSAGWSLSLVESVVANFHEANISVHFPTIVGFPTETNAERQETYDFLAYVVERYPSVTFNINILGLDVGSRLYQSYEDFSITEIRWPSDPKYFLGNLLDWNCASVPFSYPQLDASRNHVMRKLLYPWMPETAELPVYMFYRLAETSRATLVWKSVREQRGDWALSDFQNNLTSDKIALSDKISVVKLRGPTSYDQASRFMVYDWETHHQLEVDEMGLEQLKHFAIPKKRGDIGQHRLIESFAELYDIGIIRSA